MSEVPHATGSNAPSLLRARQAGAHGKVTNIELFFDLVFVYAVTQLSHTLLHDLTVAGALHVLLLFLAVWWVWIFTGWITNWLDPERLAVRLLLLVLMFAGLLLSTALPQAFESRGIVFACAYTFMQVGRSLFMVWALRHSPVSARRNFYRITSWLAVSGVLWITGGFASGETRFVCWLVALAIEYLGPAMYFYVPGLGRSSTAEWDVEGGHLAERCSLFVIIALGESVVVTGSSFADSARGADDWLAFSIAFVGCVAMWWIYFDLAVERGSRSIRQSTDPGRTARLGYTYLHLLIVAGIVVSAVGDELTLSHPHALTSGPQAAVLLGGPALYLLGNALFKQTVNHTNLPVSHLGGLGLLLLLCWPATMLSVLALAALTTWVLVVVAAWETLSLRALRRELYGAEHG
ncbi:low temperature requirement protein A [Dyella jiangningensis]|uniref:low temperature requirement protein A n=1 Tax=Dyella jiangningensis TaxID=1379159 RepID=UPI00240FADB4|nr:low temperature requirement protein A [Dyella jiangningensis]MDG2540030.1 low temperature requirement protein A [Dyella jiangningensis]